MVIWKTYFLVTAKISSFFFFFVLETCKNSAEFVWQATFTFLQNFVMLASTHCFLLPTNWLFVNRERAAAFLRVDVVLVMFRSLFHEARWFRGLRYPSLLGFLLPFVVTLCTLSPVCLRPWHTILNCKQLRWFAVWRRCYYGRNLFVA